MAQRLIVISLVSFEAVLGMEICNSTARKFFPITIHRFVGTTCTLNSQFTILNLF
jgi:hypothetical protein